MRIAFLCKRRYMGKDVIVDRYARLYEIPFQLARLGNEVKGYCLSYRSASEGTWEHDALPGSLIWESHSLGRWKAPTIWRYPRQLRHVVQTFVPDVVIGASDIPHVVLGGRIARHLGVPFAADLYDNFESFGQARIPGLVLALRHAVRHAQLVTTTSELLADHVRGVYHPHGRITAMPSTVDRTLFRRRDKANSRHAMGLPIGGLLIGTAGGLAASRGIGALYAAWPRIANAHPDAHLVLAGPVDQRCPPPTGERVHYLGMLAHARTAELFSALDVGVIYLRDTPFGRYCFPQKAYEMFACGLPTVATAVGAMPHLLATTPSCLYREDDATDLARAVEACIANAQPPDIAIDDWASVITRYERQLRELVSPATIAPRYPH